MKQSRELGMVHPLLLTAIVLCVLSVGFGGFSIWAFLNYQDQKNNVDAKISVAVADAKREQTTVDQAAFVEQEKQPARQIQGPADLGQVKLSYPKTWSVYIDKQSSSNYEAYFYPLAVPAISTATPYALRVSVVSSSYESVAASFNDRLKTGKLKSSPVTVSGVDGIRFDGSFTDTIKGSMVIFKIRDKTLEVYTQAETFKGDFDSIVLKTLEFNK